MRPTSNIGSRQDVEDTFGSGALLRRGSGLKSIDPEYQGVVDKERATLAAPKHLVSPSSKRSKMTQASFTSSMRRVINASMVG